MSPRCGRAICTCGCTRATNADASGLATDEIEGVIRRVSVQRYMDTGAEIITAANLGPITGPGGLVGCKVQMGRHGGPECGIVTAARREGDQLIARMRLTSEALDGVRSGVLGEFSSEYSRTLASDGATQTQIQFRALALLPPGTSRCGSQCSVLQDPDAPSVRHDSIDSDDDALSLSERAHRAMVERARVLRVPAR